LLDLLEKLVQAQREAFDHFLTDGRNTVARLQQMFTLSLWLLLGLTVSLAVLVYRGMIAPLRQELDEKRVIIERQEKLASLGLLAAGVAHEIRNPLTAIKFRLFTLKKSMPPEFSEHEDTRVVEGEINRLERIVKDFLHFARPSDPDLVRVPAEQIQREVYNLLKSQLEKNAIQLQLETSEPAWIYADTQQIKQVLINLIQNAADSIGRNGVIVLRVLREEAEFEGRVRPAAVLQVADTGKGIAPEVEKRLFDPFFSTKETGTGLGLALAARIIARHGGLIRHHTQLHRGTTFEIVLPRLDDHETKNPPHRR